MVKKELKLEIVKVEKPKKHPLLISIEELKNITEDINKKLDETLEKLCQISQ